MGLRVRDQVRAQVLTPVEDRISDQISIRDEGRVIRTLCEDRIWETVKGSLEKYDER